MPTALALEPLVFWFVAFSVKHVLADFPLQSEWMVLGKDRPVGWVKPLAAHCAVHGSITLLLVAPFHQGFGSWRSSTS